MTNLSKKLVYASMALETANRLKALLEYGGPGDARILPMMIELLDLDEREALRKELDNYIHE